VRRGRVDAIDPKETLAAGLTSQRNQSNATCPHRELAFATTHGAALV
jgi:hypothetical protein